MSDIIHLRSDTSSIPPMASGRPAVSAPPLHAQSAPAPRNTNPLLSAAVTNLTLDDFTHSAVLMPAALPVIPAPAVLPMQQAPSTVALHHPGTFGTFQGSDIPSHHPTPLNAFPPGAQPSASQSDGDNFSEISLDQASETFPDSFSINSTQSTPQPYSIPGQSATLNALAALPNVASVFSSFSNIITGIAQETVAPRPPQPQQEVPFQNTPSPPPPAAFNPYAQPAPAAPVGPPPRLYSPHDAAVLTDAAPKQPPIACGTGNNYRLNAKRKVYAPLPGLNTTHVLSPETIGSAPSHSGQIPPVLPTSTANDPAREQYYQPQPPAVQSKTSFSLSSLISNVPLLDKFQQLTVASQESSVPLSVVEDPKSNPPFYPTADTSFNPYQQSPLASTSFNPTQFQGQAVSAFGRQESIPLSAVEEPKAPSPFNPLVSDNFETNPYQTNPPQQSFYNPTQFQGQTVPPTQFYPTPPPASFPSNPTDPISNPHKIPPPLSSQQLPPAGGPSSFRLRGKPHYRAPNTYGTVAAQPLPEPVRFDPFAQAPVQTQLFQPQTFEAQPPIFTPAQPTPPQPASPAVFSPFSNEPTQNSQPQTTGHFFQPATHQEPVVTFFNPSHTSEATVSSVGGFSSIPAPLPVPVNQTITSDSPVQLFNPSTETKPATVERVPTFFAPPPTTQSVPFQPFQDSSHNTFKSEPLFKPQVQSYASPLSTQPEPVPSFGVSDGDQVPYQPFANPPTSVKPEPFFTPSTQSYQTDNVTSFQPFGHPTSVVDHQPFKTEATTFQSFVDQSNLENQTINAEPRGLNNEPVVQAELQPEVTSSPNTEPSVAPYLVPTFDTHSSFSDSDSVNFFQTVSTSNVRTPSDTPKLEIQGDIQDSYPEPQVIELPTFAPTTQSVPFQPFQDSSHHTFKSEPFFEPQVQLNPTYESPFSTKPELVPAFGVAAGDQVPYQPLANLPTSANSEPFFAPSTQSYQTKPYGIVESNTEDDPLTLAVENLQSTPFIPLTADLDLAQDLQTLPDLLNRSQEEAQHEPQVVPVNSQNLSSFFDTTSTPNWFNPIPASTPIPATPVRPTTPPTLVKTEPTDSFNFFAQTNQFHVSPPEPTAPSTDFLNTTQIQNFFNNPPPLLETQQQLDLVKDCQNQEEFRHEQKQVTAATVEEASARSEVSADTGSVFSNFVEPPSSVQSEFSEYATQSLQLSVLESEVNTSAAEVADQKDQEEEISSDNQYNENPAIAQYFRSLSANQSIAAGDESAASADSMASKAATLTAGNIAYRPVYKHWFFNAIGTTEESATTAAAPAATKSTAKWVPFSMADSQCLQESLDAGLEVCTTNGGRFDVNVRERRRTPVYWTAAADEVRCCSWFFKGSDSRLVPYEEELAQRLEAEYKQSAELGEWNRKLVLDNGDTIVFHAPNVMVHFTKSQSPDSWTENSPVANRPRVIKRGIDEFNIEDGESEQVDHLMFMVHGIGSACDLKFRSVEQVVEDFRTTAQQLVQSHYRTSIDRGRVGRIEVLPISWHSELHSEESGIDEKLRSITLESIPKLRTFTNSTLLDILFYTSPVFCQQIIDAVANSINRKYNLYRERNPAFTGDVSLAGHSLGSVILFDLLQNQVDSKKSADDFVIGQAGTGQQSIRYPALAFRPKKFFAFGSPIGMFVTVRGINALGLDYKLPTCDGFYNIFHPYDPVAYRIEALISPDLATLRPVLIPHHKGRKRMHLELRETIQRVGNDIKQRIVDTFKSTMNRVYHLSPIASSAKSVGNEGAELQSEVDHVLQMQAEALDAVVETQARGRTFSSSSTSSGADAEGTADSNLGQLNEGRRVDYVLQEAPLEFFNEYLFALTSHVCYWESSDTTLFIAKEIYSSMGIRTDNQIPQQTLTIERPITPQP